MSEYKRNIAIDVFKGIAIVGVVVAHTIFSVKEPSMSGTATFMSVLTNILFSGLMMFFVFSGFFFKSERKYSENILKRVVQLGLVMIILQILLQVIVAVVGYVSGNPNIDFSKFGRSILGMIIGPFFSDYAGLFQADYLEELYNCVRSYYFIQMMLAGFVIFYAIANKCYNSPKYAVFSIIVCIAAECALHYLSLEYGTRLPFFVELAPLAMAFMLVGLMFKHYKFDDYLANGYKTGKYWIIAFSLVAVAALIFIVYPINMSMISFGLGFKFGAFAPVPFFVGTVLAGTGLIMLSAVFNYLPVLRKSFSFVGKHTLWIFLTNIFFVRIILTTYGKPNGFIINASPITTMPEAIFYLFFALAASLLLSIAVGKIKEKWKTKKENNVQ